MALLRMRRVGRVSTAQSGPDQCKHTGHDKYAYDIRITCHEKNKDDRGFIVDNMLVQKLVQDVFDSATGGQSCENIVCCVGKQVENLASEHNVAVLDVYVHIWPEEGATPVDNGNVASFEYSLSGKFL
jgi:hypothetical protein